MFSKFKLVVFCSIMLFGAQGVWAENVYTCPDISKAVKVGDCPTGDELKRMFRSTCGSTDTENENPHAKGVCRSYQVFSKIKNTALWELDDGEYVGYLSCNATEAQIKAGKPIKISIGQRREWDRVICTYDNGAELVLRTRETCEIPGAQVMGSRLGRLCEAGDNDCKAICR